MRDLQKLGSGELPPDENGIWIIIETGSSGLFRVCVSCFEPNDDMGSWQSTWLPTLASAQQIAERWANRYGVEAIHYKYCGLAA